MDDVRRHPRIIGPNGVVDPFYFGQSENFMPQVPFSLLLTDIFAGEPPPQPIALALAEIVGKENGVVTRRWFDRVLDARMADLERTQLETLEEMET